MSRLLCLAATLGAHSNEQGEAKEGEWSAKGAEAKAAGIKGAESSALGAGASQRRPSARQRQRQSHRHRQRQWSRQRLRQWSRQRMARLDWIGQRARLVAL